METERTTGSKCRVWGWVFLSILCLVGPKAVVWGEEDPNSPNPGSEIAASSIEPVSLSIDPNDYAFLVYSPFGSDIQNAMTEMGLPYSLRNAANPVSLADLESHDILIVGWNDNGDVSGLDPNIIYAGITGRVLLTGHDADYHTANTLIRTPGAKTFLIQTIEYVLAGGGTGLVGLGDYSTSFSWLPQEWDIEATNGLIEEEVTAFTQDGIDSGVFDNLIPADMSNWGNSFHNAFNSYGIGFRAFEMGLVEDVDSVITIAAPINPMGFELYKYDDIADGNCVAIDNAFEYTIEWHNTTEQTFYEVYLKDVFPVGVDYPVTYTFDPNTFTMVSSDPGYDGATHTYIYPIGTLTPDDSDSIQLTVTVNENAVPGMYLHNVAELWATVYDANGLNPVERLIATAYEDTLACCWDTSGILYVDQNAPAGGNGMSWELAYNDLQDALTRARETECTFDYVIYVAQGTYAPEETPEDGFVLPEGVSVYGGYRGGTVNPNERNPKRYETILTGLIDEDEFPDAEKIVSMGNDTLLDGFTVTQADFLGYGVYGNGVNFTLSHCVVQENYRYGIYAEDGNVAVQWCTINSNGTDGIRHIRNIGEGHTLTIDNSWIMRNGEYGVYTLGSTLEIRNSIVSESDMMEQGRDGIYIEHPKYQPKILNATIANNKAEGVFFVSNNDPNNIILPDVQNSIIYYNNNGGPQLAGFEADTVANFCCIQDCNTIGTTNINVEPKFAYTVDPNGTPDPNNYHLSVESLCIDSGNPFLSYTGQVDIDGEGLDRKYGSYVDIGADEVYDCDDDYLSEIDVHNAMDWGADGIVNLNEFVKFSRAWLSRDPNEFTDPNLVDPNAIANWNPICNLAETGNSEYVIDLADLCVFLDDWLWVACWKLDEINAAGASAQTESLMTQSFSASQSLSISSLDATAETVEAEPEVSVETLVQIIGFLNEAETEMPDNIDAIGAVRAILVEQLSAIVSNEEQ